MQRIPVQDEPDLAKKLRIFVSYTWTESAVARQLVNELTAAGVEFWIDYRGIHSGDSMVDKIGCALEWCNVLLLIWSNAASSSRWVKLEWENAITLGKKIIPCRLDGTLLPTMLASTAYIDFRDITQGINELLQDLGLNQNGQQNL